MPTSDSAQKASQKLKLEPPICLHTAFKQRRVEFMSSTPVLVLSTKSSIESLSHERTEQASTIKGNEEKITGKVV